MKKVITYGTFDLFHYGHQRLLERAKNLGDYLIVGVTSDDFDKARGKLNVQQNLIQRIENIRKTGLADEILIEEYEGQKIDDIVNIGIDVFAIGSDWKGKFDYLNDYCDVIYLERTEGISSTQVRSNNNAIKLGIIGDVDFIQKIYNESLLVNGLEAKTIFTKNNSILANLQDKLYVADNFEDAINSVDAVYIASHPTNHFAQIRKALENNKHVICESPIAETEEEAKTLFKLAEKKKLILIDAIKTAYSTAYNRLLLLLKSGKIGKIISVDATCTSLKETQQYKEGSFKRWNSISEWGPFGMLPIFALLGTNIKSTNITSLLDSTKDNFDIFTKVDFCFPTAVGSFKVAKGAKSEGSLIITGTEGYVYVPAPWWKMDYFELRYENIEMNKRYFYQLNGEGIRNELLSFVKSIIAGRTVNNYINKDISINICKVMEAYNKNKNVIK